jgi:hypothetical protein
VAADQKTVTAFVEGKSGGGLIRRRRLSPVGTLPRLAAVAVGIAASLLIPAGATAASNKVRITNLTDVAFGSLANLSVDAVRSQSVCLYADTNTNGYSITATGTGPSGSFQLTSGLAAVDYEVQWSSTAGQSNGAQLAPNVPLTGQVSSATHQVCTNGPATSASLILVLRSSALSSAEAGTYNGTLTLIVGPE